MMSSDSSGSASRADVIRQFFPTSPYVDLLGMQLTDMQQDTAVLTLPFAKGLATIGSVVHGGAIASLIDTAAMVAAWSDHTVAENLRGSTVNLSLAYLAPADGEDLRATAHVLRRGSSLVYLDVEVQGISGKSVARGLVTYKLG